MSAFRSISGLAASFAMTVAVAGGASAGDVVVEISGLGHASGELRVALFDSEESFLEEGGWAMGFRVRLSNLAARSPVVVTLHGVAPGRYGVTAHHDEDGDGKRGANFLGIPTEGYGFSNDARGTLGVGPPGFEAASFEVGGAAVRVPITLSY